MAIRFARIDVKGVVPLLTNNPRCADRFDPYVKRMAAINAKKTNRTDDDYMELRLLELQAKAFFDEDIGVYVPTSWLIEAIACNGFKVAKKSRDAVRGSLFAKRDKVPLAFNGSEKVKALDDLVHNPQFRHLMAIPQQNVRVMKTWPIYHGWSFSADMEFDDSIIDFDSLARIAEYAGSYGGFGDFRPKFGRAQVEVHDA